MPFEIAFAILVVGLVSVQVNPYGALIYAVVSIGSGASSVQDWLILTITHFTVTLLVTIIVKTR